jgi:peptidoglycan/xylan/chitin deacetylase (PgdA/CDA1 family)
VRKTYKTQLRDFFIAFHPFYQHRNGPRILCFHDIQNAQTFERRIQWLLNHFEIVTLHTLLEQQGANQIALTFDDAYQSWFSNLLPLLNRYNLPATFFVNSGLVGLEGQAMSRFYQKQCKRDPSGLEALSHDNLLILAANPQIEIGGHTKDHYLFSKNTSESMAKAQIQEDKNQLEAWTGRTIRYFAYPFGQVTHAPECVQKIVEESGYQKAFSIVPGFVDTEKNPYFISRDSLELFQSERLWDRWLHGAYDELVLVKNKIYNTLSIPYR